MLEDDFPLPKKISGSTLKIIAILSMLIDHVAAILISVSFSHVDNYDSLYIAYIVMRNIGRIAFPLFCFLVVEGFIHTKNRYKYIFRLFIFAIISEVAFDLAFSGSFFDITQQNVIFTLLFGVIGMWGYEKCYAICMDKNVNFIFSHIISIIILILPAIIAKFINSDYSLFGVLTIALMYLNRNRYRLFQVLIGIMILAVGIGPSEFPAFLAAIFVIFYNDKRGLKMKYFFYLFYPLHLIILYLIGKYMQFHLDAMISGML